jgi:sugar lactone lactonase YvrE
VQGCGFDHAGNFYATEFEVNGLDEGPTASPLGALVKIAPDGTRTTLGMGSLFFPSGFAAGSDGSLYVSNCSIAPAGGFGPCPNGGEVVRVH